MQRLNGKIALITGAGRGIGRAIAELFAEEGATIVMTARTESDLLQVETAIRKKNGDAVSMPGDVTHERFVHQLFSSIRECYGRLDILVNNAGTAPFGPVEDLPVEKFRQCLELNVLAVFMCMQQAVRLMRQNKGEGKIINVGSVRTHWSEAGDGGAYNASKFGLKGLTESVARQLHGSGVNIAVSLVCPGAVDTPLTNPRREPRPDWLRPRTVAEAVLYVALAPASVNIYDITLFPMKQSPW